MGKKELTIAEIQAQALKVLKHVASFCDSRGLRYSIAYGTLIGAVRHHGFIPWDDDIDIIMPRSDYETFLATYNDAYYKMIKGEGLSNHLHVVVSDPQTVVVFKSQYDSFYYKGGVWVDIFPMDLVPDKKDAYEKLRNRIKHLCKLQHIAEISIKRNNFFVNAASFLIHVILHPFRNILGRHAQQLLVSNNKESETCANLSLWYLNYPPIPSKWLESYDDLEFEGTRFKVLSEYHEFLTKVYGNYMQLPPEKDRVPRHSYKAFFK